MSIRIADLTLIHSIPCTRNEWFTPFPHLAAPILGLFLLTTLGNALAAAPVEINGELDVIITSCDDAAHSHSTDPGHAEFDYFLRDDNGQNWYQLQFKQTPPGHLRSGQRIKVRGQPQGRKFQVESLDEQNGAATTLSEPMAAGQVVDERKAVVLMVNLSNATVSLTRDQITGRMFTDSRSVDGLYREASLGQMSFPADTDGNGQPDIFGPFTVNYDNSNCDYYSWASAAESAAQAAGVNLSLYKHRVFVLPNTSVLPSCSWAGIANVGCGTFCRAWISGSTGMIFAHELGHNLNLAHAGNDPENDGIINNVYADYSDPMGSSSSSWYLFNAAHIDQMGWYAGIPGAITTVTASGTYDVSAMGNTPMVSGAPSALKIAKKDSGDFYYLSYRQVIGDYNQLSTTYTKGVNIHRYKGTGYGYTTHIKTLIDGESFTDSANGITVSQVSQGSGYATVEVNVGGGGSVCVTATPTVALSPTKQMMKPGVAANFAVAVTNQDAVGCAQTVFALNSGGGAGSLSLVNLTLSASQSGSSALTMSGSLAEGQYALTVSATDADGVAPSHSASGQVSATLVVDGTPPTVPTGLKGVSDKKGKISLSWLASSDVLSGVAGYTVYRNGAAIGQVTSASFTDSATKAGTTYNYTVSTRDTVGNVSVLSNAVTVTAAGKIIGNPAN